MPPKKSRKAKVGAPSEAPSDDTVVDKLDLELAEALADADVRDDNTPADVAAPDDQVFVQIIADQREKHVRPHFATITGGDALLQNKTITTGDFAITANGQIVAIFERKTLEDFAASFKDGRDSNRNKLLDLREKTGCDIYYIIEHKSVPKSGEKFGRIPYFAIRSSLNHMMVRDRIFIINTADCSDTAKRLVELAFTYRDFLHTRCDVNAPVELTGGDAGDESMSMLTARHVPNLHDQTVRAWCTIKGITTATAPLAGRCCKLKDIVNSVDALKEITRTTNGRAAFTTPTLRYISFMNKDHQAVAKLLGAINGISKPTAEKIASIYTLGTLGVIEAEHLADFNISEKRKLGAANAKNIIDVLNCMFD